MRPRSFWIISFSYKHLTPDSGFLLQSSLIHILTLFVSIADVHHVNPECTLVSKAMKRNVIASVSDDAVMGSKHYLVGICLQF